MIDNWPSLWGSWSWTLPSIMVWSISGGSLLLSIINVSWTAIVRCTTSLGKWNILRVRSLVAEYPVRTWNLRSVNHAFSLCMSSIVSFFFYSSSLISLQILILFHKSLIDFSLSFNLLNELSLLILELNISLQKLLVLISEWQEIMILLFI